MLSLAFFMPIMFTHLPKRPPRSHVARDKHSSHAFTDFHPLDREGLTVLSRRNMLKASVAGFAGLSLPTLLKTRAEAVEQGRPMSHKSVILLWMTGGPSQIDTWDPKPE